MFELAFRIAFFIAALSGIVALLSYYIPTLPTEAVTAIAFFIDSVNDWGFLFPLQSISAVLGTAIVFWTIMTFWDISSWLLTKFTR